MKNRLFPIVIGLCFISLIGVAFLRALRPQTEAPPKPEPVQASIKPTDIPQTENATRLPGTDATAHTSMPSIDNIDMDAYKAALRSKDLEGMKEALGPEYAARIDAAMKFMEQKTEGLDVGEFPDFNIHEYMEIFMGEDAPKIDWEEITQSGFREHFPEGEPADYEAEMAERIYKIVADTPGAFQKVMLAVMMKLAREQDFQFWALANFKGEIGEQMDWVTQQILVAGELENIQYTVPEDMSTLLSTFTEASITPTPKSQATTPTTESTEPTTVRSDENGPVSTEKSETVSTPPMLASRIKSIREILSQNGADAGLLKLLETDKDAANYLLERFNSPTEIEAWLSKQVPEVPQSKSNPREIRPQPFLPPEVQP